MGAATAIAGAGLALQAGSTVAGFLGGNQAQAQSAMAAQQQAAWAGYNAQVQAAQQSAQADWERSIARQNVELARRSGDIALRSGEIDEAAARDAEARGEANAANLQVQGNQAYGTQRAILAAQGTDLAGSPSDVLADTEAATDYSMRSARSAAAREAYGYRLKGYTEGTLGKYGADIAATSAENDVALAQAKQDNARPGATGVSYTSSNFAPTASLLSGASSLADKWLKFQDTWKTTPTPSNPTPKPTAGGGGDYLDYGSNTIIW